MKKCPDASYSSMHEKFPLLGAEAKRINIYGAGYYLQTLGNWRRTRLAMPKTILRAGLVVIEAWFGGY